MITCPAYLQRYKGGRQIKNSWLYSNPNSKLPSLVLFLVIWIVTEQIACGNLCLEPKVSENSERGSEERFTLVLHRIQEACNCLRLMYHGIFEIFAHCKC